MSPSEFDLRAALRDGEDDSAPDVDGLVAAVRSRRAQRRVRVLSGAAAVVLVAAAAVGGAVLWGGSNGGSSPAADHATSTSRSGDTLSGGARSGGSRSGDSAAVRPAAAACPSSYPGRPVPGVGLSPAARGPMFASPVATVLICAYTEPGSATGSTAAPLVLTGGNATALANSIEQASKTKLSVLCPTIESGQKKQLAIIGLTANGRQLPVVTTDVSIPNCNQPITNGTAFRWAWKPPASLAPLISALTTRTARVQPGGGISGENGSPAR